MKLLVRPESSSYNLTFGTEALRTELDGGRGRYRADILGASTMLEGVQWRLDPDEYDYFMAFYRTESKRASLPFTMDLMVDSSGLVECDCNFIPGSVRLSEQSGITYVVSASIEVKRPVNLDEEDEDGDIISEFNTSHNYTP